MNKYIKLISIFLNKVEDEEFELDADLEYLSKFKYNYESLSKESVSTLFKLFYLCFSRFDINKIDDRITSLREYIDRIKAEDYSMLSIIYDNILNILESGRTIEYLYIKQDTYENMLEQFKNLKIEKDIELFIISIFSKNNKIDFRMYNQALNLLNTMNKLNIFKEVKDLLEIQNAKIEDMSEENRNKTKKVIRNHFPHLLENISNMNNVYIDLAGKKKKFISNKKRRTNALNSCKESILNNNKVNINEITKFFSNDLLEIYLLEYNNSLVNKEYCNILNDIKELDNNQVNLKERILATYECNVDSSKILLDSNELEQYIKLIDKSIPNVKKYNNIMLLLLNKLSLDELAYLLKLINNKLISERFLLDNIIDIISNIDNFIKNIELLKIIFNIKDIVKFDKNILYLNNEYIKYLINIYKMYNINFNSDIHNFDFLKKDYSYQIDKFIEIGLYDLIKNNIGLISNETDIIIKRCLFNKYINEPILNDNNKLCGYIRKEETYLLSDEELVESMLENYTDLIPIDIIEVLSSNITNFTNNIDAIDNYLVDDVYYNFDGMLVSKNKVLRNYSKLKDLNISESDKILYSILYNYPSVITKGNVCFLNNILKIKIKSKC